MSVSTETTTLRQRREAIVQEHMDAENRHDVDATLATFHRPCYDVVPVNEMHDGSDSVRDLWDGIFSALPAWPARERKWRSWRPARTSLVIAA